MTINIVGIDCATQPQKVGMAIGEYTHNRLVIKDAKKPQKGQSVCESLMDWISGDTPTLLAMDAPLGWPSELGEQLSQHHAGDVVETEPNRLFRRETDYCIKKMIGKQSLDVGADRIARTAHSALSILQELREQTAQAIPMAWGPELKEKLSVIEVYPAATLIISGIRSTGYKKKENSNKREEILSGLEKYLTFNIDQKIPENDDDILDAVICVLAGFDFLTGKTIQPGNMKRAKKEGWIWVRYPARYVSDRFDTIEILDG